MTRTLFHRILPITALLALAAGCAGPTPSGGESAGRPMNTPTVGEFSDFLKSQGHSPRLEASDSGSPTLVVNEGGDNFIVYFYDCTPGGGLVVRRCTGAEFTVSYPVEEKLTLSEINHLNQRYRMAKTYVNAVGDPGISLALNTGGAFNSGNLRDVLERWIATMRAFEDDIGWT